MLDPEHPTAGARAGDPTEGMLATEGTLAVAPPEGALAGDRTAGGP